jgi:SsrA-binding protein
LTARRKREAGQRALATNRAASHEYHLLKRLEAGIVLTGPEVKSARLGRVNLKDAYARIENGELFLVNAHFSPYTHAPADAFEPLRPRKLLVHAGEIRRLAKETTSGGMTLVPTRMYLKSGRIKVEIAVARGKRSYDKRESSKKREMEREMQRAKGSRSPG